MEQTMKNEHVKIFDTTLRDGEQSPGFSMNLEEKFQMAKQLERLHVDVIEAGFPIASEGDFLAVENVAKHIKGPVICGLARAELGDIDACIRSLTKAKKSRIHTFIASSDIHLKHKLRMSREEVLEKAVKAVTHARQFTDDVEFSAEDATRSDPAFLVQLFTAVIEAGATTINVPDTVGYTIPSEFSQLIRLLKDKIPVIERAVISVHCHNDLGLAVSNSLAAIQNGARQVECTVNGIGERAGNASMEEIVMALKVRNQSLNADTQIVTEQIYPSSKLLTHITGIRVQPNKAIVGANAFAHESGIHQDGLLKEEMTYSIMTPQTIGLSEHQMVLGKHSGRHALKTKFVELGYDLNDDDFLKVFQHFKELADKKKNIYDEDLHTLIAAVVQSHVQKFVVDGIEIKSGTDCTPQASVRLSVDGTIQSGSAEGDGPVDATFKAIKAITGFDGVLERFTINAVTGGADAQGEVMVTIRQGDRVVRGIGSHTDIVVASAYAYVNALNRLEGSQKAVTVHM
jgi:2-isopropylmalate synthase